MSMDDDMDFIAQAMPAFISEAAEQIEAIETLLLELEEQPDNRELLDSLFRCAHTVKGSAGIFGLNRVVEFTHHVETLLDKMRDGDVSLIPDISTLLLQCNDQIKFLVDTAADESADTDELKETRADLVVQLRALTEGGSAAAPAKTAALAADAKPESVSGVWSISARFGPETFRNGMDPLSIARYLSAMGEVVSVRCGIDGVPPLLNLDPEGCYLSFAMQLQTSANRKRLKAPSVSSLTTVSSTSLHRKRPNRKWPAPLKTCRVRRVWAICWCRWARSRKTSWRRCSVPSNPAGACLP